MHEDKEKKAQERIRNGDYVGAEKIYEALRAENPRNRIPIIGLADVYLRRHETQRALMLMKETADKFKRDPFFYKHLCKVYRAMGDENNALNSIEKALLLDPENPVLRSSLGFTYWFFGNIERAIEEAQRSLELALEQKAGFLTIIMVKNNLACYYAERGIEEDKAKEYATFCYKNGRHIEVDESRRTLYLDTYGYVKMRFARDVSEIDEAIAIFDRAIKEGAPIEPTIEHLTKAYQKRKQLGR